MASLRPRKPVNPTRRRNRRAEASASPPWSLDPPGPDEPLDLFGMGIFDDLLAEIVAERESRISIRRRGRASKKQKTLGQAELARSLAPLTVGGIALVALASWLVPGGGGWNGTLIRATFVGSSAVAVPHLLLHGVAPLCEAFATRRPSSLRLKPRMTAGNSA